MDIQVTVDPNDYNIERGVYASWLGNALPDVIAQGLIDDGFAALTTEPTNNNSGSGNALPTSTAFSTAIPLDDNKYSAQTTISGATAFTLASGAVTGGQYTVRLVADGTNTPTFSSAFNEVTGSSGYDNTANVVNVLSVYYDGVDALYSWTQRIGDTGASDVTAPTFSSYVVSDGAADTVVITASEVLDQTSTLATGDFAVSGHTVSAAVYGSATTIELTVTPDFVNGEATRTFTYTNNANRVVDLAGNPAATTSAQNITNNVGAAPTAPAQVTGLTLGTATDTTQPLTWTAPSDGGSAITDYVVQYSTDDATWTTFADGTSTTASATVTGLTASTTYYYRVAAVNSVGTGTYSASASGDTASASSLDVQLLLNMNGSNGSTTFTDSSVNNQTMNVFGAAQISTADSKFGGASADLTTSGAYLTTGSMPELNFGNNIWTIEFWIKNAGLLNARMMSSSTPSGNSGGYHIGNFSSDRFGFDAANLDTVVATTTSTMVGNWVHIAFVADGSTLKLYRDGVLADQGNFTGTIDINSGGNTYIGYTQNVSDQTIQSYVDDLRISGTEVYTAGFTPPASELTT